MSRAQSSLFRLLDLLCTFLSHSKSSFLIVLRRSTTRSDVWPTGWAELAYSCEPTISLKWTTTQRLPRSSSTDRAWRRRSILLRASRLLLLNRIWTMSKYGTCWLHHCTYRKEKQVQTDHKFITRTEKTLCQVHLVSEQVRGDLQLRSHKKRKSSQESHSDRDGIPWAHWAVQGENESLSRLSETENHNRLTLEEPRDHQLSEARSEALKQECRADFLDCSIRELQRQIRSSRMEIDHTTLGCETSRRDQARPGCTKNWRSEKEHSEKLSLEVFTKWKNWKRSGNATWRILQARIECTRAHIANTRVMNDSREFQDLESVCSGKLSHIPSQPAVFQSLHGMLGRDQSLRPDTWNVLASSGNVFDSPLAPIDSSSTLYRGRLHSWILNATDGDLVRPTTERL